MSLSKLESMKTRIMTVDLEPDLGSHEGKNCKSMIKVVPQLLNLFDDHKIKATFFTVTSLLEKYETPIKEISQKHEIASHSHTHHVLNPVNACWEMKSSKEKLKEYGINAQGFRAPQFITTTEHFQLLKNAGYSYDASLARCYPSRYCHLTLPGKPFVKEGVVEFPTPNFAYPVLNSGLPYLKLFHPVSRLFPQPYLFYLHPWEFLEKKELKENSLLTRGSFTSNPSTSNFLLTQNCGQKAWEIFENYLERCAGKWIGCNDWMKLKPI